jgi:hypothetical protein
VPSSLKQTNKQKNHVTRCNLGSIEKPDMPFMLLPGHPDPADLLWAGGYVIRFARTVAPVMVMEIELD